ncbi:MAG: LppX_LprAFG lipoprotein, partial [Anaerolineales bacterium]
SARLYLPDPMLSRAKRSVSVQSGLILAFVALGLAACAGPPAPTPTPIPTPTPQERLDRGAQAMLDMQSAKFTLIREGEPATLDPSLGLTFSEASGAYQAPNRVEATIKVGLLGNVLEIRMLWLPEGDFMTNPLTQTFLPTPPELSFDVAALFAPEGFPLVLREGIQQAEFVARESLEGSEVDHLRGEADGATLAPLTAGALTPGVLYPVDVWMEQSTGNVLRVHITEPNENGWLIELFEIDVPVEISTP